MVRQSDFGMVLDQLRNPVSRPIVKDTAPKTNDVRADNAQPDTEGMVMAAVNSRRQSRENNRILNSQNCQSSVQLVSCIILLTCMVDGANEQQARH